jgi:drug/metabolite transporter (DMT)-like permease
VSAASAAQDRRPARGAFLLLCLITLFWGLNWPVMKLALGEIPVLPFRALCLLASGPALLAIAALRGDRIAVPHRALGPLLLAALFNVTLWQLFTGYGVSHMSAGRASIIAYTMPAWATLLGALVLGEPLTARRLIGLALGIAGMCALLLPDLDNVLAEPAGALSMVLAAMTWAAGTLVLKRWRWSGSSAALTVWQICLGGLPILIAAVIVGPFPGLARADTAGIAALVYVVVFGMVIAQWAWFVVVDRLPMAIASISTMAIPATGVLTSALLLGEPLGGDELIALILVVGALALVLRPPGRG